MDGHTHLIDIGEYGRQGDLDEGRCWSGEQGITLEKTQEVSKGGTLENSRLEKHWRNME